MQESTAPEFSHEWSMPSETKDVLCVQSSQTHSRIQVSIHIVLCIANEGGDYGNQHQEKTMKHTPISIALLPLDDQTLS
jgi:hypothetical protein